MDIKARNPNNIVRDPVREPSSKAGRAGIAAEIIHQRCKEVSIKFRRELVRSIIPNPFKVSLDVSRAKPACPRPNANSNGYGAFGRTSEDCLYLNVFTKNLKQSQVSMIFLLGF